MAVQAEDIFAPNFLHRSSDLQRFVLAMLKGGLTKPARDEVGSAAARFVRDTASKYGISIENLALDAPGQTAVQSLRSQGFACIGNVFTEAEIATIQQYVEDKPLKYYNNGHDGADGQSEALFEALPHNTRFGYYGAADICRCPTVYKIVNDLRLIRGIAGYLQTPPTISTISLWWTFPSDLAQGGMQFFHHDRGDFRSCNLFVYLTDVPATGGPHAFVKQTHSYAVLRHWADRHFANKPEDLKNFWQWMETHRKSDGDVKSVFGADQVQTFTGPKGTSFLEDTLGLHRAVPPEIESRLVFEIVFTTLPKYNEPYAPIPRGPIASAAGYEPETQRLDPLVRYATRSIYV